MLWYNTKKNDTILGYLLLKHWPMILFLHIAIICKFLIWQFKLFVVLIWGGAGCPLLIGLVVDPWLLLSLNPNLGPKGQACLKDVSKIKSSPWLSWKLYSWFCVICLVMFTCHSLLLLPILARPIGYIKRVPGHQKTDFTHYLIAYCYPQLCKCLKQCQYKN